MSYTGYIRQRIVENAVTQTPQFKAWFGKSKVVDARGNPLIVYHGTPHGRFDAFNPEAEPFTYATDRGVFHFTTSRDTAQNYANFAGSFGEQPATNPHVFAAYISLQNPFIIDNSDSPIQEWDSEGDFIRRLAEKQGRDGIIIETEDGMDKLVIAFHPNQIKSVSAKMFNPASPNLEEAWEQTLRIKHPTGPVDVDVHRNPTPAEFKKILAQSREQTLRGSIFTNGDLLVWDAFLATHGDVDHNYTGSIGAYLYFYPDKPVMMNDIQSHYEEETGEPGPYLKKKVRAVRNNPMMLKLFGKKFPMIGVDNDTGETIQL